MKGLAFTWTNIAAYLWIKMITLLNKYVSHLSKAVVKEASR